MAFDVTNVEQFKPNTELSGMGGNTTIIRTEKPMIGEIQADIKRLTNNWSEVHSKMQEWEGWMYEGCEPSRVPAGYDSFKEPLHWVIRGAAAQIVTDTPKFKAIPSKRGNSGENQKSILEGYADKNWEWADAQARCSLAKELVRDALGYGACILQGPVPDVNAWGVKPTEGNKDSYEGAETYAEAMELYYARRESRAPFNPSFWWFISSINSN